MRAPLTPIKAYVHDVQSAGSAGKDDATNDARLSHWLTVAQAAERLAKLPKNEQPAYVLALARGVLPPRGGRPTQTEGDGRVASEPIEQLAERLRLDAEDMERAGCFELALTTVSAVCRLLSDSRLSARLLATAHMGRVARQIGDLETATDCYSTVVDGGKTSGDGPVAAHGYIGLGNVAHARGNRPEQKSCFRQALELAHRGSPVELSAHQGLMVVANLEHDLADALLHGWRAHDLAPPDSEVQLEIIGNLARTAFESEFFDAARSGFDYVIQRAKFPRIRLPAIGGAMRVAAVTNRRDEVSSLDALGQQEISESAAPFDVARFLLWNAEAWQSLGDVARRNRSVEHAIQLAGTFGFNEIRFKAEAWSSSAPRSRPLTPAGPRTPTWHADSSVVVKDGIHRLVALSA